ncbi:MAG: DUF350 domain-containing protein [Proteobacteria bacterium]|nr:DUF350 domain-containing protein [Pseudomonadota bacterium]MBU1386249.1 DUF350 domain-containing protein [Pseudomonadota bacterium]MBU1542942.1 DUF350 domain-containing protein [Pseudomonadota bacterium]MBU2429375.1 DUF350 domain-containing protein [Pseudomonadota bacterium]MBU2481607.1 DUF350 domain-containing protein [Pseudomonadota bacterium]
MNIAVTLTSLGQGFIYVIAGICFIGLVKKIDDWRTKDFNDDDHIDDGNLAVGLRRAGLYLGIAIALSGVISGISSGFFIDLIQLLIDGLIIAGFMFSSRFINDFIMLGHINNDAECIKTFTRKDGSRVIGNTAVGTVECGMYIATGFILRGAFSGAGGTFFQGIASAIVFFILGQMALLVFGFLYELITPYNIRNEIKNNNPAAGIGLGGILIALGIILMGSLSGPFTGWSNDLLSFGIYTAYGIIMLLIVSTLVDKLLLPTTSIAVEVTEDHNSAALIVVASVMSAVAIIISFSM